MTDTHTEDEAVALMVELDAGGMRSRQDFFQDVMRQWPGVFRDVPQAIEVYLSSYPEMLILQIPLTRALLDPRICKRPACPPRDSDQRWLGDAEQEDRRVGPSRSSFCNFHTWMRW